MRGCWDIMVCCSEMQWNDWWSVVYIKASVECEMKWWWRCKRVVSGSGLLCISSGVEAKNIGEVVKNKKLVWVKFEMFRGRVRVE